MKKTLYIMRHGETLFNAQHKVQGWCDSPLTQKGIEVAKKAATLFDKINIDHAYSSTSERASDTLEIVTRNRMPYQRLKALKEHNFGLYEGQDQSLQPRPPYGDFFVQFGGESDDELLERSSRCLREIMNKEDHESVLVVAHGGLLYSFIAANRKASKDLRIWGMPNCCVCRFSFEDDVFTLEEIIVPE